MTQEKPAPWRRRFLKILAVLLVFLAVVGIAAWFFPQPFLTVDSGPVQADVIVIVGGAWLERPLRAVELFQQRAASRVLVSGSGECAYDLGMLQSNGVPDASITLEDNSLTTQENAEYSAPLLRRLGAKRVIIVTSWYHSRRAICSFKHYAPEISFYSRPSYYGDARSDWRTKNLDGQIRLEYFKLLRYWVRFGICPF